MPDEKSAREKSPSKKRSSSKGEARRIPESAPASIDDLADYLGAFTNFELNRSPSKTKKLGPQSAAKLLDELGLVPTSFPVIQVAGSKGKGSTVLWMESLLMVRGQLPGAYLSPHLERINERVRIAGEELGDDIIVGALQHMHPTLQKIEREFPEFMPTFFDLWTVVSILLFDRARVTHGLLEVGLGGPLDSTSAVPHEIGVLTSVDLEHRAELGNDMDEIAREKARIARADRPFVIADLSETWGRTAAQQARSQGAEITAAPIDHRIPRTVEAPQDRNLAVAIATLEALPGFESFEISEIEAAVRGVQLKGRLEELTGPPPLLLDSAHTKRSMEHFQRRFVSWRGARPGAVIVGFVDGKEWVECLEVFAQDKQSIHWIVTTPEPRRRLDPEPIAKMIRAFGAEVEIEEDVDEAIDRLRLLSKQGHALGATGSFYLSGQVRQRWEPRS